MSKRPSRKRGRPPSDGITVDAYRHYAALGRAQRRRVAAEQQAFHFASAMRRRYHLKDRVWALPSTWFARPKLSKAAQQVYEQAIWPHVDSRFWWQKKRYHFECRVTDLYRPSGYGRSKVQAALRELRRKHVIVTYPIYGGKGQGNGLGVFVIQKCPVSRIIR